MNKENVFPNLLSTNSFSNPLKNNNSSTLSKPINEIQERCKAFEQEIQRFSNSPEEFLESHVRFFQYLQMKKDELVEGKEKEFLEQKLKEKYEEFLFNPSNQQRHKDDIRFLRQWINYVSNIESDIETHSKMFEYLIQQQIGINTSLLYIAYATLMESNKDFKKASAVYKFGKKNVKDPKEAKKIEKYYEDFKENMFEYAAQQRRENETATVTAAVLKKEVPLPQQQLMETSNKKQENLGYAKHLLFPKPGVEYQFEELRALQPKYRFDKNATTNIPSKPVNIIPSVIPTSNSSKSSSAVLSKVTSMIQQQKSTIQDKSKPISTNSTTLQKENILGKRERSQTDSATTQFTLTGTSKNTCSSPTIHTKAAMSEVLNMFSGPIGDEEDNFFEVRKLRNKDDIVAPLEPSSKKQKFSIFADDEEEAVKSVTAPAPKIQQPLLTNPLLNSSKLSVLSTNSVREDLMNVSMHIVPSIATVNNATRLLVDPFASKLVKALTEKIVSILRSSDSNFIDKSGQNSPPIELDTLISNLQTKKSYQYNLSLKDTMLVFNKFLGKGAFGTVFKSQVLSNQKSDKNDQSSYAVKLQSPANVWEYYMTHQIQERIKEELTDNKEEEQLYYELKYVRPRALYYYKNTSFMQMELCDQGTLHDLINMHQQSNKSMDEYLVMYYTIELLKVVQFLHKHCKILHCDIKPDNIMLINQGENMEWGEWNVRNENGWNTRGLKLIDFGRAIDLTLFSSGQQQQVQFTNDQNHASGFGKAILMEKKPWKYEIDYYGICGVVHCMLFGNYMQVERDAENKNRWSIKERIKRIWQKDLWQALFDTLLNEDGLGESEGCGMLLDLQHKFEEHLINNPKKSKTLKNLILKCIIQLNSQ